jgi:hypothetical protein
LHAKKSLLYNENASCWPVRALQLESEDGLAAVSLESI